MRKKNVMERSPLWVAVLGVLVQLAALGLCSWAMDESIQRGRRLRGTTPGAIPPPSST